MITGSNGLLGQKLVYALRAMDNVELLATARGPNRLNAVEGYAYQTLDITGQEEVVGLIKAWQPDVIINAAAMTQVDQCAREPAACDAVNVGGVRHLIAGAEAIGAHLIHVSTDFVFNGLDGPYREDDIPDPVSHYGRSKLQAEQLVQAAAVPWSIVRTVLVYGITDNLSRSNVVLWVRKALQNKETIRVVDDQFRTPTYAEDLAEGILRIAQQRASGVFHLSGKDTMSIVELARTVADHFNLDRSLIQPISSASLQQDARRPPRTGFVLDKARETLGFEPRSFQEGLDALARQLRAVEGPA
ncbi:MAG: dTDP-4-dehydrorhamnose reductase [Bacteroidota bacterium]